MCEIDGSREKGGPRRLFLYRAKNYVVGYTPAHTFSHKHLSLRIRAFGESPWHGDSRHSRKSRESK